MAAEVVTTWLWRSLEARYTGLSRTIGANTICARALATLTSGMIRQRDAVPSGKAKANATNIPKQMATKEVLDQLSETRNGNLTDKAD